MFYLVLVATLCLDYKFNFCCHEKIRNPEVVGEGKNRGITKIWLRVSWIQRRKEYAQQHRFDVCSTKFKGAGIQT